MPTDEKAAIGNEPERAASVARKDIGLSRRTDPFYGLLLAGVGVLLIALAAPRTIAAWVEAPALPVIATLDHGRFVSVASLAEGISALRQTVAWISSGPRLNQLARLEFELLGRLGSDDPKRAALLVALERDLTVALLAEPSDGFAWVRLAIVREQRGADARAISIALAQSLDVAPNARPLWLWRARLLLKYSAAFSAEELPAVRHQLQTIWTADSRLRMSLTQMAQQAEEIPLLTQSLVGDTQAQDELGRLHKNLSELANAPVQIKPAGGR